MLLAAVAAAEGVLGATGDVATGVVLPLVAEAAAGVAVLDFGVVELDLVPAAGVVEASLDIGKRCGRSVGVFFS